MRYHGMFPNNTLIYCIIGTHRVIENKVNKQKNKKTKLRGL
jgi:hypothetical protein